MHRQGTIFVIWSVYIESSYKSDLFSSKTHIFLPTCAICSELPSNISTNAKVRQGIQKKISQLVFHFRAHLRTMKSVMLISERRHFSYYKKIAKDFIGCVDPGQQPKFGSGSNPGSWETDISRGILQISTFI